jgi:hypothetical protein
MFNQNDNPENNDLSIREKGRKFLEELKAKGPNNNPDKKIYVMPLKGKFQAMPNSGEKAMTNTKDINEEIEQQETDSSVSASRQLRQLRIDIIKERSELRDLISKQQGNPNKQEPKE